MKKKEEKNSKENIEKLIGLFYMHCNNYADFTTFSVDNVCRIYNVDIEIVKILEEENAIRIKGVNGQTRYTWGVASVNNEFIEKIYNKLSNTKQTINKNKVMKKNKISNGGKKFSDEEIEFLQNARHLKASAIAKKLGRSKRSIETKRLRLKWEKPITKLEDEVYQPKTTSKYNKRVLVRKRWTKEEEMFIKTNLDKNDKWLGGMLNRTERAICKHRSVMGVAPPRGKGKKNRKLPKFLPVSKARSKEKVIIPEKATEVKSETKLKRIRILWGVVDIQY